MKPLLRAVLIVDAGLYLSSGAALLLSPLSGVQRALLLTSIEPAMVGQMLGLALLGLAWLSLRGALDGAMTVGAAKIVGHVTWLAGALVLAWTIGPHALWLPALGIVPNLLIGAFLVVIGLGGARFAGAVRRREIGKAAQAAGNGAKARVSAAPATVVPAEPVLRPPQPSQPLQRGDVTGAGPHAERAFTASPAPGVGTADASASAGAASGSGDVRGTQSAPRPPFHG